MKSATNSSAVQSGIDDTCANTVIITVDAMGGDDAPDVVLQGAEAALEADSALNIILCGPESVVVPFADAHERCEARVCMDVIDMGEHAARAVRKKRDSSIVIGCKLVKEGSAQGFFSAGSTGACLAAATLFMARIKGIKRPALATVVPSPVRPIVLTDVGANADCKPEYLLQFAQMGIIYSNVVLGTENPSVALLNIGEEEEKGSEFAQECYQVLRELPQFRGNAEGRDVVGATYDVVVCDGFTGNVCLKTIEGTAKELFRAIKGVMKSSVSGMFGGLLLKKNLYALKDSISAETYGGAPLLGVRGACVVGHGSSSAKAIENGILFTARMARGDIAGKIASAVRGQCDQDELGAREGAAQSNDTNDFATNKDNAKGGKNE